MATKAELFHAKQQRDAKPPRAKQIKRARRDVQVDTALPGKSATDRRAGNGSTASRNRSARVADKGGAALEDSATGQASRKSTRKSSGRAKRSNNLRLKAVRKAGSPVNRATKAKVKAKAKVRAKPQSNVKAVR